MQLFLPKTIHIAFIYSLCITSGTIERVLKRLDIRAKKWSTAVLLIVNLKSNTMKNTLQRYELIPYGTNNPARKCLSLTLFYPSAGNITTPSCFFPSIITFSGCWKRTCLTNSVSSTAGMASRISFWKIPSPL